MKHTIKERPMPPGQASYQFDHRGMW